MRQEVGVTVFGSCVSRDTVEYLPPSWHLIAYVARQSLISLGAPAAGVADRLQTLPSAFQDRMVRGDVRGDALAVLGRVADRTDVLLVDLVDERSGVVEVGGGFVTRLTELWAAGGARATAGGRHLRFGTDEHFALWTAGLDRLLTGLDELGLRERVLALRTPWAARTSDGDALDVPAWMTPPETANRLYQRYFEALQAAGLDLLTLPDELAHTPRDHRWGPSPFHYGDEAYVTLAAAIVERSRDFV